MDHIACVGLRIAYARKVHCEYDNDPSFHNVPPKDFSNDQNACQSKGLIEAWNFQK
jgi:hypothetical protein